MKPISAYNLYRSLGVNAHIDTTATPVDGSPTPYRNTKMVIKCLQLINLPLIRDCPFYDKNLYLWKKVADATGAKFIAYLNQGQVEWMQDSYTLAKKAHTMGLLAYIEGGNEEDSGYAREPYIIKGKQYFTPNSIAATQKMQKQIAKDFKGKLPIINMSLGNWIENGKYDPKGSYDNLGDMTAVTDLLNIHTYPQNMQTASTARDYLIPLAKLTGSNPIAETEFGYHTTPLNLDTTGSAVPEDIQAIYYAQAMLSFSPDLALMCFFELLDQITGHANKEGNWGLFHSDGTPKPAVAPVSNIAGILATAKDVPLVDLDIQVVGRLPSHKIKLYILDTDKYMLAAWREDPLFDSVNKKDLRIKNPIVYQQIAMRFQQEALFTPYMINHTVIPPHPQQGFQINIEMDYLPKLFIVELNIPEEKPKATYTIAQFQAALDALKGQAI